MMGMRAEIRSWNFTRRLGWLIATVVAITPLTAQDTPASQSTQTAPDTTAQSATNSADQPKTFEVGGDVIWMDTQVELNAGDQIKLSGSGTLTMDGKQFGPDGASRGWRDLIRSYPVNSAGSGALIGRFGDNEAAQPFLIGQETTQTVPLAGRLFLGLNKSGTTPINGTFTVVMSIVSHAAAVSQQEDYKLPPVTLAMIDEIPRRVVDADGNVGDNNNFVIVGPEAAVVQALETAGWVKVDPSTGDAVVNGIMAVLNKDAYLTIPMSPLMMFGRVQDYGFAHAEPIAVVAERHHFRLWKAPFTAGGREVWAGAGTHDIGFDRDQRNNGITHKIDPDVDKERDFIGQSLKESGMVATTELMMPSAPNKDAKTATGGSFFSDGQVLVIQLKPQPDEKFTVEPQAPANTSTAPATVSQTSSNASSNAAAGGTAGGTGQIDPFQPSLSAPQTPATIFQGGAGAAGQSPNPQNSGETTTKPNSEFKTPEGGYFDGLFPN